MSQLNSPLAILKLLNKSNCRDCNLPTCLAFAGAVFKKERPISDCPHLGKEIIEQLEGEEGKHVPIASNREEYADELKAKIRNMDLSFAAERLGERFANGRLTIKVCGKDFSVDSKGNFFSEIHIHSWLTGPIMTYIIEGAGVPVSGKWMPFRELKGGMEWAGLFGQTCEKRIKMVADKYTDLFEDMLHLFNGKRVENYYESDISLVLYPLPNVPILFCYWKPEDGLDSSLNIFFDSSVEHNLNTESAYGLGTGFATMFEKIALRHGY